MSYPQDLEDYRDDELEQELGRRRRANASGICSYCGRRGDVLPMCKNKAAHEAAAAALGVQNHQGGTFVENIAPPTKETP